MSFSTLSHPFRTIRLIPLLAEPDAISEWVMHLQLIAPRQLLDARASIAVVFLGQFRMEGLYALCPDEECRSRTGIAMMLGEMKFETGTLDGHIQR